MAGFLFQDLLIAQGDYWIDAHGAPCGDIARDALALFFSRTCCITHFGAKEINSLVKLCIVL